MGSEFDLIARFFSPVAPEGFLGVGDDCAVLAPRPGRQWVSSVDLLLQGRHFAADVDPEALGHKALAVNVSDLAAMGARPEACLLGLALPAVETAWLHAFSKGFLSYAQRTGCALVGGDTTRSVSGVQISVTVLGTVPDGKAMRRSAARPGDDIWVTGLLGGPHFAWQLTEGRWPAWRGRLGQVRPDLDWPDPPWQLAQHLTSLANAAVDISDGLLQDLGHVLRASGCGAVLDYAALPVHAALADVPNDVQRECVLAGGEVYQLCFTAPVVHRDAITGLGARHDVVVTRVGHVLPEAGLQVMDATGVPIPPPAFGYDHFSSQSHESIDPRS